MKKKHPKICRNCKERVSTYQFCSAKCRSEHRRKKRKYLTWEALGSTYEERLKNFNKRYPLSKGLNPNITYVKEYYERSSD